MIRIESGIRKASEYMSLIAGAAIIIMMLLSTADVLLRLGVPLFSKLQWWFLSFLKRSRGRQNETAKRFHRQVILHRLNCCPNPIFQIKA